MDTLQITAIFVLGMIGFASGRLRHDLVSVLMLLAAVALGLVSAASAFEGFADPVVLTVATVMALSAAIGRSGVLRLALKPFRSALATELGIAGVFAALCAVASAFMNNVGAVALLLPAAIAACKSAKVSPSRVLMPMAFASLLGGLMTMIGTPPNVIIATLRAEYTGEAFGLFDFAAVGVGLSLAGVACLLLFARVVPLRKPPGGEPLLFRVADYLFEVKVQDRSGGAPLTVGALRKLGTPEDPIEVHAIDRGGLVFTATSDSQPLFPGDVVQLEGRAPVIEQAIKRHNLTLAGDAEDDKLEAALTECVVTRRSRLIGDRAPLSSLRAAGAALLAISRNNRPQIKKLQQTVLRTGDIVLLQVAADKRSDVLQSFGLLPLADRALELVSTKVDWRPVGMLAAAIVASALQWTSLSIALMAAIAALVLTTRRGDRLYSDIDWSIIVMLAAIIPVANAFTALGGGDAAATWLAGIGVGQDRAAMIALVLGLTMAVTPFLNNAAAVLVMAPIAAQIGTTTGYGIDAMLMAVAVGASCDFLTPIGHQSNTLVMGPGGYRFLDYARLGLPLSVLVLVLGTALIDNVW